MKLLQIVPELIVADMDNSIQFYRNYFEFEVEIIEEETVYHWAQLSSGDSKLMMQTHSQTCKEIKEFPKELSSSNILVYKYYKKEDVRKRYEQLKKEEIEFFMELTETDYGIEFGIFDPDHYRILVSAE